MVRRMGNMEWHLVNAMSTASLHHLEPWKSPRWAVIRIQALAVVAIIITFLLVVFGSCRRWSNRWLVQKGFFAAQALSLSLGTYSIGLMQSSSVKSEMYPIWTVSLFVLFGCVDPVTTYNGLDYKGALAKVVYGIFLYCGYVLLMSISTISSVVGHLAISILSAITFIKSLHRSLALVHQSRMRSVVQNLVDNKDGEIFVLKYDYSTPPSTRLRSRFAVDFIPDTDVKNWDRLNLVDVGEVFREKENELKSCYRACIALCLSHSLQRQFYGFSDQDVEPKTMEGIDYKWALKVIEIELAFLHEVFFTGNAFLHYYQAKAASLWALASFIGICFVGVAAAIPGIMASCRTAPGPGGCTNVVDTTTADLVITFVILASLALLQLMQLIRCWASNWARVAVVCAYARNRKKETGLSEGGEEEDEEDKEEGKRRGDGGGSKASVASGTNLGEEDGKRIGDGGGSRMRLKASVATSTNWFGKYWWPRWMRLKAVVATSTNWFDKYLWQDKLGQYSILPEAEGRLITKRERGKGNPIVGSHLAKMLGLDYIWELLWDLLGNDTSNRGAVTLDHDVKASIIAFLDQIKSDRLDESWLSFPHDPCIERFLPYSHGNRLILFSSDDTSYANCFLYWYIATLYCELAEQKLMENQNAATREKEHIGCRETAANSSYFRKAAGGEREKENRSRRVAKTLSRYCAYLLLSAPELLPGRASSTKGAYDDFAVAVYEDMGDNKDELVKAMSDRQSWEQLHRDLVRQNYDDVGPNALAVAVLGEHPPLLDATGVALTTAWETLAHVWVRMLVYAAPYGNAEAHMWHLQQGGEFITHLWALLHHLAIHKWKLPEKKLYTIWTTEEAERILTEDDQAIVAFLDSLTDSPSDELAAAFKLEDGVNFYQTTSSDVAMLLHIDQAATRPSLVFLKKDEEKFYLYDGEFERYAIARFVSVNKLPLVTKLTPEILSSLRGNQIQKLIILVAVANESSKFLPYLEEAANSFKGRLLFIFVERDNEESKQAADELIITCTGEETMVLACTKEDKREFRLDGEVSLHTIEKFAQDFFEDKLYISEPVPESNDEDVKVLVGNSIDQIVLDESKDVLLVIYNPMVLCGLATYKLEAAYNKLAKHLRSINSLVIAKMDGSTNWHPRAKMPPRNTFKVLFYPAGRKRFEPIPFKQPMSFFQDTNTEHQIVDELFKFIKDHARIPFEQTSTLEEVSAKDRGPNKHEVGLGKDRGRTNDEIKEERSKDGGQTDDEIEEEIPPMS